LEIRITDQAHIVILDTYTIDIFSPFSTGNKVKVLVAKQEQDHPIKIGIFLSALRTFSGIASGHADKRKNTPVKASL
jgi:hypothetical protein